MQIAFALAVLAAVVVGDWKEVSFGEKSLLLDSRCEPLNACPLGPFVKLKDGDVLAVDDTQTLTSKDDGKTWTPQRLFQQPDKFQCRTERALLRTNNGVLILAFLNAKEMVFKWDQSQGGPLPKCRLPAYIARSHDDGKTWEEPQKLQDGFCGAVRSMIQLRSGRVVLACQIAATNPGRHVSLAYVSDDEGKTWTKSNTIDLGEYGGFGDHGGGIEATLVELKDGRLWMLLRTPRGCFSEAFSEDQGLTWKDIRPSTIEASGSPGLLARLQDGRLMLLWNRYINKKKLTGRREQLSISFSDDDGQEWSAPVVLAYDPMKPGDSEPQHRLSYPYLYEHVPGQLWVTTMQGPLRIRFLEQQFLSHAPSGKRKPVYTIVAFGDSTTAPRGRLDVYADLLQEELAFPGKSNRVINAGIPGNTTEAARSRFQADVLDRRPDAVILQFGINDAVVDVWTNPPAVRSRVSLERYTENLRYFVRTLRERGVRVLLMTPNPLRWTAKLKSLYGKPPYRPDDPDGLNMILKDYAQSVRQIAQDEKAILIDVFAAFRDPQTRPKHTVDQLLLDGMHPNDQGHRLVADLLLTQLKAVLCLPGEAEQSEGLMETRRREFACERT